VQSAGSESAQRTDQGLQLLQRRYIQQHGDVSLGCRDVVPQTRCSAEELGALAIHARELAVIDDYLLTDPLQQFMVAAKIRSSFRHGFNTRTVGRYE